MTYYTFRDRHQQKIPFLHNSKLFKLLIWLAIILWRREDLFYQWYSGLSRHTNTQSQLEHFFHQFTILLVLCCSNMKCRWMEDNKKSKLNIIKVGVCSIMISILSALVHINIIGTCLAILANDCAQNVLCKDIVLKLYY